ncbi:hypothetical protein ACLKA7_005910 [Drosophila subpalustris]
MGVASKGVTPIYEFVTIWPLTVVGSRAEPLGHASLLGNCLVLPPATFYLPLDNGTHKSSRQLSPSVSSVQAICHTP